MSVLWRWAAIAGAVLGAIVVAAVLTLVFIDWNVARDRASAFLSGVAGREVRIGFLDVEPGWTTSRVVLRDLWVANADWAQGEDDSPFASAKEVLLTVETKPLLWGRINLPEVVLREPTIDARKAENGDANWRFGPVAETAGEVVAPEERGEFPYVGRLEIQGGKLTYRDATRGLDLAGTVATATGDTRGNVELTLEGTLEQRPVTFAFTGASLLELREGDEPYPFDLTLVAGGTEVRAAGTTTEPVQLQGLDVSLRVAGPSMADIFPIFGIPLPETAPYHVEGQLQRDGAKWRFDGFSGKVDDSDLAGWIAIDYTPERPVMQAEWVSQKLDLHDLGGLIGLQPNAEGVEAADAEQPGGLLPDTPIDLERLNAMDMDLTLKGERVHADYLPIDKLDMRFIVEDGQVRVEPLVFYVADGRIAGVVTVDAREAPAAAAANLAVQNLDLKPFFRDSEFVDEMGGRFVGTIDVAGRGESLADMLAAGNGDIVLGMEGGSVSGLLVEAAGLDLVEALALVIEGDTPIGIRCGLIEARMEDGVARFQRGLVDTTDSLLVVGGAADLGKEAVDVQIEAHEKDFSLIDAAAPVRVAGPFRKPSIAIGGVDPLPFFEMGDTEDINCVRLLRELSDKVAQ
jgi:uncharacterized protein involved in outer membrane biogenesis